eukprot:1786078-Amphidinium_carterae.2
MIFPVADSGKPRKGSTCQVDNANPAQSALQMTTCNPRYRMTPPLSELLAQKVLPDEFVQHTLSRKSTR